MKTLLRVMLAAALFVATCAVPAMADGGGPVPPLHKPTDGGGH